jgi:hypothetical protein
MCKPLLSFVFFVLIASAASAQTSEMVGVRALGMAGAFTAVADDSTATWWNPAGLATGAYFNGTLEYDRPREAPDTTIRGVSVAFPALGLSYYRFPLSQIRPSASTAVAGGSRQDEGVLSVYGATVGQSIGNHLVVGSTVKLARAGETHAGLDVGAMASYGHARVGLMVRNAREPEFGTGPDAWKLRRHARAGVALTSGSRGAIGSATLAIDADLMTTMTNLGDDRRIALGGEVWTSRRVLGLRGGVSASTLGERRSSLTAGVSTAVRTGTYIDAHVISARSRLDRRGWGVALRVTF